MYDENEVSSMETMQSMCISKEEHSLSGTSKFDIDGYDFEMKLDSIKNSVDIVDTVRGTLNIVGF